MWNRKVSCLGTLLTSEGLYSWGPENISRKMIMISSYFMENIASFRKTVMDAADHCVTIEFIQIESEVHPHVQWGNFTETILSEKMKEFTNSISELENCMFRRVQTDYWSFWSLFKRWLQDIKDELEEPLQSVLIFKDNVVESTNKIFCNLFPSIMQIADQFRPCQTCRCHGAAVDTTEAVKQRDGKSVCPITGQDLDTYDLTQNGVKIGLETILLLPSFKKIPKLEAVFTTVVFNIIECIRLPSLSEGLFFGSSHVVLASSNHEMDATTEDGDQTEANHQIFSGLCQVLNSIDCGLICTSTCDIECMCEVTLPCFYLLQPSDNGPMLLRRIAAAEEFLPVPDVVEAMGTSVSEELTASINSSLTKMGFHDYNPLHHERGYHTKLNWLVKESLQFRSMPMPTPKSVSELNSEIYSHKAEQEKLQRDNIVKEVHDRMKMSPSQFAKKQIPSILERMEPLRTFNKLNISLSPPTFEPENQPKHRSQHAEALSGLQTSKGLIAMKKPLVPFPPSQLPSPSSSPRLKPNFRRIKRTKN